MNRYIATLLLLLVVCCCQADDTRQLTMRLDSIIDNIDALYSKKQTKIDFYKAMTNKQGRTETRLTAYENLYEEYFVFQFDSAMVYANKALALANQMADRLHQDKCRIKKASLLAVGGLYGEAVSLLNTIDSTTLDPTLRFDYTITYYYIYTYWSDYCHDDTYAPQYRKRAADYLRTAMTLISPDDPYYVFYLGEYYVYVDRNDRKALDCYFQTLKTAPVDSRWYAMASFAIANNYSANNNGKKYEEYLLKACISDLLSCTRENLAMQDLAMYLFKQSNDNIPRAERYINFAMDDAKSYNNRLRIIEISQKLPVIVSNYRAKLSTQNRFLKATLWGISVLLVFVVVLLYSYSRQNRQLAAHRRELSENNERLSEMNDTLHTLNSRLVDTNSRRERLAKLYIDLCARYIDKLGKFEVLVKRKIKVGQVNDLLTMASSSHLSEQDAATFMQRFDSAFLDLYPSFVDEFNVLLKEGEKVVLTHPRQLTTELRIFALVRLGVKESSEIAALLFYTPRTIYNYRSAFKNRALNRDTFEADVEQLCRVIRT